MPIRDDFDTFVQFSEFLVNSLGLSKDLKAVLFNADGCPYAGNLDLSLTLWPKIDYSEVHYVVFTKTAYSFDALPQQLM